ncbi:MAG: nucleotidyltransferase family protein [bacterium]
MSLLTRSVTPANAVAQFPDASLRAWELFLAAESCSAALTARLANAGPDSPALPVGARAALGHSALAEIQRVMAVRAQLAGIDAICDKYRIDPIVLKGGVHAIDAGDAFDLGDVDLWLSTEDVLVLQRAMVTEGGYELDLPAGHQFGVPRGQLRPKHGVAVELHECLDVGFGIPVLGDAHVSRSQRLNGWRRLRRLDPTHHVVYCVQHTTTHHALRRGHLRDLLLIADAMDDCSPDELASARAMLRDSVARDVYLKTLLAAGALRNGARAAATEDLFRRVAAGKYAVAAWFPKRPSTWALPLAFDHVIHFTESATDGRRLIAGLLTTDFLSSRSVSPTLARYSERLARLVGFVVRTPSRLIGLVDALVVAAVVRINYALRWR